jgi:hypothetical protein
MLISRLRLLVVSHILSMCVKTVVVSPNLCVKTSNHNLSMFVKTVVVSHNLCVKTSSHNLCVKTSCLKSDARTPTPPEIKYWPVWSRISDRAPPKKVIVAWSRTPTNARNGGVIPPPRHHHSRYWWCPPCHATLRLE